MSECNGEITNCIIWGNSADIDNQIYASVSPNYTCIQDWIGGGTGNISSNPLFADPNREDYHLKSRAGRWDPNSLRWVYDTVTSPCVDAGDPADPNWTNELWPHGKRINMGAYGGTPEASMSSSEVGNVADLSHNDCVGLEDLMLFIEKWLVQDTLLAEDMDLDNRVNLKDFSILAENWSYCLGQDLVGYWRFNETGGTQASDSSMYGNHGTLVNGPAWTGDGKLSFDGINDYVEVPHSPSLDVSNQITLSAWILLNARAIEWPKIVIKPHVQDQTVDPWELYCLDLGETGEFARFSISSGVAGSWAGVQDDSVLSLATWYHIVGTYDGSLMSLYVDGQLAATQPASIQIGQNNMPLSIGGRLGINSFNGVIDEVRVYNRALTETEIQNLYQSHETGGE